ncbi:Uma2 family endonuclease [Actinomadura madurae]|uniref:Uma2 family endonuclease n=1 Tax=Actinomadura madurae TaxID=1993 RepID=UPI0020D23359|nr:Uma2 family endonuclease [Actinomadura madurae]MCP9954116.1 Uma2 family endonuclease [Actinomadura madurae]MCP9970864.1 Uma2 family endonuclease [Actinomadura madurae]MCP9983342.1 Uma2 family endonuclease [Actinomadura madurae]MCQ0005096.1 Uma2 family endonuclease [Actinomadura madurae]MCQ0019591.1 Uma2 family endonuclease [Actinomadura madurae]
MPDTPYNLWVRRELGDYVDAPEGSRIEIIEGEVVVSPAPGIAHGNILRHITRAFDRAEDADPDFPWAAQQGAELELVGLTHGYIPDLVIAAEDLLDAAGDAELSRLMSDEIEMAIEVTSPKGAELDRPPHSAPRRKKNKWSGYARAGVPYYLLVDRSPKAARTTLFSIPDQSVGAYLHQESRDFGEPIHLPEPFGIEIDTGRWRPWKA